MVNLSGLAFGERARNPLLPIGFNDLDPLTQNSLVGKTRDALEKATYSVLQRIQIPISESKDGKIENVAYFPLVNAEAEKISPDAEVMPSAGVLRSVEAYLCDQLEIQLLHNPQANPLEILGEIAKQTQPIPAIDVRGVGGDFDVLVRSQGNTDAIIEKISGLTNSAENDLGATKHQSDGKRLVFTVADVKDYETQIRRTTRQGGATIDYLAFSMKNRKFVEPPAHDYIIDDFIRGYYRYLAPFDEAERPQKQTVRGIRALLEFPFLDVQDPEQLKRELLILTKELNAGSTIDEKAIEQIGKAIRNGRNSLADNRILRGEPDSLEEAISQFSKALLARKLPHIPEYVSFRRLETRDPSEKKELNGLPRELLISSSEFLKNHTTNGHVFHGTPTFDNAMAILRGGLYLSGGFYNQGGSYEGSGGYAASSPDGAAQYPRGVVLDLKILDDPRINILDMKVLENSPFFRFASSEAARTGRSLNDYLRAEHGIDIIVGSSLRAVLIQNMAVVSQGTTSERIRAILESSLRSGGSGSQADPKTYFESLSLLHSALQMGIVTDIPPEKLREQVKQALGSEDKQYAGDFATRLVGNPLLSQIYGKELLKVVPHFSVENISNLEEGFDTDKRRGQIPPLLRTPLKRRLVELIQHNANLSSATELGPVVRLLGVLASAEDAAEISQLTALLRDKKITEYRLGHANTLYLDRELFRAYFSDTKKIKEVLSQTDPRELTPLLGLLATELARPNASRLHAAFLAASVDEPELVQKQLPEFFAQKSKFLERVLKTRWGLSRLIQSLASSNSIRSLVRQLPDEALRDWASPLARKYPWEEMKEEDRGFLRELYFKKRNEVEALKDTGFFLGPLLIGALRSYPEIDPVLLEQIRKDIQSENENLAKLAMEIIKEQHGGDSEKLQEWLPGFDKRKGSNSKETLERYRSLENFFHRQGLTKLEYRILKAANIAPEQYAQELPLFALKNDIMEVLQNRENFGYLPERIIMALTSHRVWPREVSDYMAGDLDAYFLPIQQGTATFRYSAAGRKKTGPTPVEWYSHVGKLLTGMQFVVNPTPRLLKTVEKYANLVPSPEASRLGLPAVAKRTFEALSKASELAKLARASNLPTESNQSQEIKRIRKTGKQISDSTPELEYRMIQLEQSALQEKSGFDIKCLDALIQLGQ